MALVLRDIVTVGNRLGGIHIDGDADVLIDGHLSINEPVAVRLGARVRDARLQAVAHYPKVGRDQPCPCGSRRKFRHCHGL